MTRPKVHRSSIIAAAAVGKDFLKGDAATTGLFGRCPQAALPPAELLGLNHDIGPTQTEDFAMKGTAVAVYQ
jgi:hypothetical protein